MTGENISENIQMAAREIAKLKPGSITDPIAYAVSLNQRFGLSFRERHQADMLALEIRRRGYIEEINQTTDLAVVKSVVGIAAHIMLDTLWVRKEIVYISKKITRNHLD